MSQKKRQIVIIGGVAAGMKTASRLRRLDANCEITVIDRNERISYGACALPYFVEGLFNDIEDVMKTPAGVIRTPDFFSKVKGVKVINLTEAQLIDRKNRTVLVKNLRDNSLDSLKYDQLILATGNRPLLPPIAGIDLQGVYPLKTTEQAEEILAQAHKSANAVVIGGGLIGLEMAEALRARNLKVTLVEMQPQVLAPVIDAGLAGLVHRELRQQNIQLRLNERVTQLRGAAGQIEAVITDQGVYPAELVIMAIGVKPEISLAADAGLTIGSTGAIAVDNRQMTNDPHIYAAGDCAETYNQLSGDSCYIPLGSTANKQGRVAADNIAGKESIFPGVLGSLIVKVFNQTVARTGLNDEQARLAGYQPISAMTTGPDRIHSMPGAKPVLIKLTVDRSSRKLIGAQMLGPGVVDKRIDTAIATISLGGTIDQLANMDLAYAPPFATAMDPLLQAANVLRNKLDGVKSLEPGDVKQMQHTGMEYLLLDVRSPAEHAQLRIPGATLLPLGSLRERLAELPKDRLIVPFCKLSLRGYEAQIILQQAGFNNVSFLEGGILAWPFELESEPN